MLNKVSKNNERQRRHARLRAKVSGTASCPRLNVFRSNKHISCQIIDDEAGKTLVACSSKNLKLENGGNVEAAKAVGTKIAELALANNIETVVFDRGGYNYHGRVAALADAAREAGLKF
ncbi:MAG: 50S ribosomal protein L18 [Erysipelotrichaceae bacterium]|nr:50S ribosomal protein L18 [Erysipelotrichaceae bacterium]